MSFEAWGTPPDPEPRYCPVCDQESHHPDCELGKMQARAFLAEQQRDDLLATLEKVTAKLAWLNSDDCGHIMALTDESEALIASVKGSTS